MSAEAEGLMEATEVPAVGKGIMLMDGRRAWVTEVDGDVITVRTQLWEVLRLRVVPPRVVTLTPEQEAFVELVRNAMITGFMHLVDRLDEVRYQSETCGEDESAHDVLARMLGDQPRAFIAYRPFEVTEILKKL